MQPQSGGYLEATPLTSFVVMSLAGAGRTVSPVIEHGVRFLLDSMRPDGSWAIDTNLATWVTTLSLNALSSAGKLPDEDRNRILDWLLRQQSREEHPFTHARPGGFAWTDLTGGVPDADDTSGALVAMWNLDGPRQLNAAVAGIRWLLELQNTDGGIPTFCRGWGALPFDRSAPDLTAHALQAWSLWHPALPPDLRRQVSHAAERAFSYLARQQQADGSWAPLWFGNQRVPDEANRTYGTARVIAGLTTPLARRSQATERSRRLGLLWLLQAQHPDGGWGGAAGVPASIEETGIALDALGVAGAQEASDDNSHAMLRGARWLIGATDEGKHTPASPIGLYFARLWYYEELYPIIFALRGLAQVRAALTSIA
jgi:squalene-hopene/tetraprenyl-beta-curcumene cyclase